MLLPSFRTPYPPPAAFLTQKVQLDDATVKFEIWDTAGQERYRSLAPMYYRGAAAAIVVYDVTNKVRRNEKSRSHCGNFTGRLRKTRQDETRHAHDVTFVRGHE